MAETLGDDVPDGGGPLDRTEPAVPSQPRGTPRLGGASLDGLDGDDLVEELTFRALESPDRAAVLAEVEQRFPGPVFEAVQRLVGRISAIQNPAADATAVPGVDPGRARTAPDGGPVAGETSMGPFVEGARFGRFELRKCLGQGGMGAVWRAFDARLGREVALKQIHGAQFVHPQLLERFQREARAASRLDHPNLCTVYDAGEIEGIPYLAMQLVEGEDLASRIRKADRGNEPLLPGMTGKPDAKGRFLPAGTDLDVLLDFFVKLVGGIHHAHERGILHRDIKPANVMLATDSGEPVVLDFGLVREIDRGEAEQLTMSGAMLGTPQYMAPEQVVGMLDLDARTDVYALGVCLYELLGLRIAFDEPTLHQLTSRILDGNPTPIRKLNRGVSSDLAIVVATAVDPDRARRYQTAEEFADDLRRVRDRRPIRARKASPWVRTRRWTQRNPVAASLLLAIGAGLASTTWFLVEAMLARDEARSSLQRFDAVAAIQALADAEQDAQALFPPVPGRLSDLEAWQRAFLPRLTTGRDRVVAVLEELDAAARDAADGLDAKEAFLHRTLLDFQPRLSAFFGPAGLAEKVESRIDWARSLQVRSIDDHAEAWRECRRAIAADERFGGLDLLPQLGLVPLGPDPVTNLPEFWDIRSGQRPRRGPDGRIGMSVELGGHEAGVVFVLLPGGTFAMGAEWREGEPFYDPEAIENEGPIRQVTLDPFFIAKFEMTQGQWMRLSDGENPSFYGTRLHKADFVLTLPVHSATPASIRDLCRREGWRLPSEAQWEYAARGGRTGPYSVEGTVNIADESFKKMGWQGAWEGGYDDGHDKMGCVSSFVVNDFGLFNTAGNIAELTSDRITRGYKGVDAAPGDGAHIQPPGEAQGDEDQFVYRGGSFRYERINTRVTRRYAALPDDAYALLGFRPARVIDALRQPDDSWLSR